MMVMQVENLNYLFNKEYFNYKYKDKYTKTEKEEIERHFKECNKRLVDAGLLRDYSLNKYIKADDCFELKTTYPGLLMGIGNVHQSGPWDNEIKLGFSLDYITGMPYIPGSTVKGTLRSAFKMYPEFVKEILEVLDMQNVNDMEKEKFDIKRVNDIEKEIFDKGDVFFDAIITNGVKEIVNESLTIERFLTIDNITPHSGELKNPIPLSMLKVKPEVTFKFRFIFENPIVDEIKKVDLFKNIILYLGIGAKTNTGYGYLE